MFYGKCRVWLETQQDQFPFHHQLRFAFSWADFVVCAVAVAVLRLNKLFLFFWEE